MTTTTHVTLARPPEDPEELWHVVNALWGVALPDIRVCEHHVSPFAAFSDAYFAHDPNWALWYGSRGTGKSYMLALLALTKAALLDVDVVLLGGSMAQSINVREHVDRLLRAPNAPRYALAKPPTATEIKFAHQNWIRPIPASQTTVRGPHPAMTLLDEIDEMEYDIYTAAQGQAMKQRSAAGVEVPEMTVASSTWQNPEATFTKVYREAQSKAMPVHSWCIAEGSLVLTARGEVPIQEVTDQDFVMTRNGFRHVQHVTFMGVKPTVLLDVGDVKLHATADHLVAVPGGWRHAGALAADAMSSSRPNPRVFRYELMPLAAELLARGGGPGTGLVDAYGNKIDVLDIHASLVEAEVVAGETFGDRADDVDPDPAVGVHRGVAAAPTFDGFDAVAGTGAARPVDALSGEHGNSLAKVWDIGVEGDDHEFFANGILVHNCFRETLKTEQNPHGWMDPAFIERKRRSVPAEMFRVEYELGEPSGMALAFDMASLEQAFSNDIVPVKQLERGEDTEFIYEEPDRAGVYAAGADWAKEKDYTVIVVVRVDCDPWRTAYVRRFNRRPWPYMIAEFERVVKDYQAVSAHDATGLGNVVHDLVDERTAKVVMVGKDRTKLLTDYITAVEQGRYALARPGPLYSAHRGVTVDEVFGSSTWKSHLADEVAACAIAHRAAVTQAPAVAAEGVQRGKGGVKWIEDLDGTGPAQANSIVTLQEVGVVTVIEEVSDVGVFWLD